QTTRETEVEALDQVLASIIETSEVPAAFPIVEDLKAEISLYSRRRECLAPAVRAVALCTDHDRLDLFPQLIVESSDERRLASEGRRRAVVRVRCPVTHQPLPRSASDRHDAAPRGREHDGLRLIGREFEEVRSVPS